MPLLILLTLLLLVPLARAQRTPDTAVTPTQGWAPHDKFLARIKQGPIGILFIGDSIMQFWQNDSNKDTWDKFQPYHPANFGTSGENTEHILWQITNGELDGINPNPKAVVLLIGTNNLGHCPDEKPEWTAAGITKIVGIIRQKLPDSKIVLMAIFPRAPYSGGQTAAAKVPQVNAIIKNLGDGQNIFYLDIGDKFLDPQGNVNYQLLGDGLHPTAKGYAVWYDAMWPLLQPMLN